MNDKISREIESISKKTIITTANERHTQRNAKYTGKLQKQNQTNRINNFRAQRQASELTQSDKDTEKKII